MLIMAHSLEDFLNTFEYITKKPEDFLSNAQSEVARGVTRLLKDLYDFTKCAENGVPSGDALPELIIQDFDEEQIWQELELQNEGCKAKLVAEVASLVASKDRLKVPVLENTCAKEKESQKNEKSLEEADHSGKAEDVDSIDDGLATASENDTEEETVVRVKKVKIRPSEVDDQFFKLSEMEHFLEQEDRHEAGQHDSSNFIDLFQLSDEAEYAEGPRYAEFFDAPLVEEEVQDDGEDKDSEEMEVDEDNFDLLSDEEKNKHHKRVRFERSDDIVREEEEEEERAVETKSSLEMRQERLQARINQLENQALAERPWQLKGEISAASRPQNSLLEEVVDFDLTTRPAPVMTEKTTLQLEDIIRQRVKDCAWDDVERKVKPVEAPNEYKKKLVLDHEKSKLSLAQVYEQEYMKQQEAQEADGEELGPQEEPPEHQAVRTMMTSLFSMLDALCNFYFTPKQPAPEVKIVSNLPAIALEEVAPVATSDAALLAPEEVQEHPKGDVAGKAERTATDRKRERRKKKIKQRERQHDREKREQAVEKLRPGLGNKYSKERAVRDLERIAKSSNVTQIVEKGSAKSVRSSTAFFNRLQDEVKTHIKAKISDRNSAQKQVVKSTKKLKL